MVALALFLRVWQPPTDDVRCPAHMPAPMRGRRPRAAGRPDGHAAAAARMDALADPDACSSSPGAYRSYQTCARRALWAARLPVPGLHKLVQKVPPVVVNGRRRKRPSTTSICCRPPAPASSSQRSCLALLSGYGLTRPRQDVPAHDLDLCATRCSRSPACSRSATSRATRARTPRWVLRSPTPGFLYPFFGTLLGWLGVALTGSDTVVERALRRPAEDHRRAARPRSRADGGGQQHPAASWAR